MDDRNVQTKMIRKAMPFLTALILLVTQVSTLFGSFHNACVSGTKSSLTFVFSPHFHKCCCGEMGSCRCGVGQESDASWPDMELVAVSAEKHDSALRYVASDIDLQALAQPQTLKTIERRTGTGPPVRSAYLVNLTFRC
jgi:hypothetical protein